MSSIECIRCNIFAQVIHTVLLSLFLAAYNKMHKIWGQSFNKNFTVDLHSTNSPGTVYVTFLLVL